MAGVLGDYVFYNIVQSVSKATPEWGTYGWRLFLAFNASILFWMKHALNE